MSTFVMHQGLPAPTRRCTAHDLDRRIYHRDVRAFTVSALREGKRWEITVLARTSADAADAAILLGMPGASVRPAP